MVWASYLIIMIVTVLQKVAVILETLSLKLSIYLSHTQGSISSKVDNP